MYYQRFAVSCKARRRLTFNFNIVPQQRDSEHSDFRWNVLHFPVLATVWLNGSACNTIWPCNDTDRSQCAMQKCHKTAAHIIDERQ